MENENPKYLTCPWCNAQAFPSVCLVLDDLNMRKYVCPAQHMFFIYTEDTSFNFGYNREHA